MAAHVNEVSTTDGHQSLSLFLFYPLVDLVIRLWKLENFIWVWEMRACRSVGFDMCLVEIVCVLEWVFNLICNFFSVCLDRKFLISWENFECPKDFNFLVFVWIENLDFLRKFWMPKILYFKYFVGFAH